MRKSGKRLSRNGFTTVELLVVIGILVVLIGALFVGVRFITGTTKDRATRVTLRNLQGMLTELETANALRKQPAGWLWWDGSTIRPVLASADPTYNFWKSPFFVVGNPDAIASPGLVTDDSPLNRNAAPAIVNTSLAMSQIAAVPANRSSLDALPPQQKMTLGYVTGQLVMPDSDLFLGYLTDRMSDLQYISGARVTHLNEFYVASPTYTAANPAPPSAGWTPQTTAATNVPLLLDAWDNPIIFVPASGLRVRVLNGKKDNVPSDATQNFIVISPEGSVTSQYTANPIVERVGRPFWASAGPDGDFNTGDDNVYSFDQ